MTPDKIRFTCASCGQKVGVDPARTGSTGVCPRCRKPLPVPLQSEREPSQPKPADSSAPAQPAPRRRRTTIQFLRDQFLRVRGEQPGARSPLDEPKPCREATSIRIPAPGAPDQPPAAEAPRAPEIPGTKAPPPPASEPQATDSTKREPTPVAVPRVPRRRMRKTVQFLSEKVFRRPGRREEGETGRARRRRQLEDTADVEFEPDAASRGGSSGRRESRSSSGSRRVPGRASGRHWTGRSANHRSLLAAGLGTGLVTGAVGIIAVILMTRERSAVDSTQVATAPNAQPAEEDSGAREVERTRSPGTEGVEEPWDSPGPMGPAGLEPEGKRPAGPTPERRGPEAGAAPEPPEAAGPDPAGEDWQRPVPEDEPGVEDPEPEEPDGAVEEEPAEPEDPDRARKIAAGWKEWEGELVSPDEYRRRRVAADRQKAAEERSRSIWRSDPLNFEIAKPPSPEWVFVQREDIGSNYLAIVREGEDVSLQIYVESLPLRAWHRRELHLMVIDKNAWLDGLTWGAELEKEKTRIETPGTWFARTQVYFTRSTHRVTLGGNPYVLTLHVVLDPGGTMAYVFHILVPVMKKREAAKEYYEDLVRSLNTFRFLNE